MVRLEAERHQHIAIAEAATPCHATSVNGSNRPAPGRSKGWQPWCGSPRKSRTSRARWPHGWGTYKPPHRVAPSQVSASRECAWRPRLLRAQIIRAPSARPSFGRRARPPPSSSASRDGSFPMAFFRTWALCRPAPRSRARPVSAPPARSPNPAAVLPGRTCEARHRDTRAPPAPGSGRIGDDSPDRARGSLVGRMSAPGQW